MTLKNKLLALLTAVILAVSLTGCDFLAADPQNRFFYTADGEHIYVMPHPESGLFSPLYTLDLPDVQAMATDPNGKFVYVAHTVIQGEEQVYTMFSTYSVGADGHLGKVGESVASEGEVMQMAVNPSGDSLIINSASFGLGSLPIDEVTGAPRFGDGHTLGAAVLQLAVHPGGTFVYGSKPDGSVVGYSTYDGEQVAEQYLPSPGSLVIDESGKYLIAFSAGEATIARKLGTKLIAGGGGVPKAVWYEINQSNGALTEVNSADLPVGNGVAFSDARGRFVYLADTNNSQIQAFRVDAATQSLQPTAATPFDMAQLPIDFATLGVTKRAE